MKIQVYAILSCFILSFDLVGQTAIDFTFTDTQGQQHQLYEDYLDQGKTVLVDFFFVDCPPCNVFAPLLQDIYVDWGEGQEDVEFFSLSTKAWDSNADVKGYEDMHGLTNPGAGVDGGALDIFTTYLESEFGPIFGSPYFMVIAPNGTVFTDVDGPGLLGRIDAINQAITDAIALTDTVVVEPDPVLTFNLDLKDTKGNQVNDVTYTLRSSEGSGPSYTITPDFFGNVTIIDFESTYPGLIDPVIAFTKDGNYLDGVFTTDIILIMRHLLGIQPFDKDYQFVAADVSNDLNVTAADMSIIRKNILQQQDGFPSGVSWKFNPSQVSIDPLSTHDIEFQVEAIKIGDVNRH